MVASRTGTTTVLKLGGELLEDAAAMRAAAAGIAALRASGPVAVVHGGGRAIDADLKARGKAPAFVDGLRVTDADTLDTVVSVLAGRINTAFVGVLAAAGVQAVGLTGADASIGLLDAGAAARDSRAAGPRTSDWSARRRPTRRRSCSSICSRSATCRSSPASA